MPIHYKITIRIIFVSVIEKRYVNKTRSGGTFSNFENEPTTNLKEKFFFNAGLRDFIQHDIK